MARWSTVCAFWLSFAAAVAHVYSEAPTASADLKSLRKKAAHRIRRVIFNNDGCDAQFNPGEAYTAENFLKKRMLPAVEGSQVDSVFYCDGVFNLYTRLSDVSETLGGQIGPQQYLFDPQEMNWLGVRELIMQGRDPLQIIIDYCRERKLEVFYSLRMNDTHDSHPRDEHLLCQWKKAHHECLIGQWGDQFPNVRTWSAVNYEVPAVRDKVFAIIQDVCTRYDVDGIELDFFRDPAFFKPQWLGQPVRQEQCDMMTGLLQRVRWMTEEVGQKRGRPLLIAVRVSESMGFNRAIGLDVIRWLEQDLADLVIGGDFYHLEPWDNLVTIGKKYGSPVYACLSLGSRLPKDESIWRGEALMAWRAGVDGIYTFNRYWMSDPLYRELGDQKQLEQSEWEYEYRPGAKNPKDSGHWLEKVLRNGTRFIQSDAMPKPARSTAGKAP